MKKLSQTMSKCLKACKDHGSLFRHSGGFWASEDVEFQDRGLYGSFPVWYFSTGTIRALLDRNIFEVTETEISKHGEYPVRVNVVSKN